eukprot:c11217_g2_i1.p1 GENE.c11217_g2_i1~~c11217_g2_i1.p1  ORF type:complete len:168 (+),score=24.83 c11217_g2_i1:140-643(+)
MAAAFLQSKTFALFEFFHVQANEHTLLLWSCLVGLGILTFWGDFGKYSLARLTSRVYTSEQLAKHDGRTPNQPILIAIYGSVFDLTPRRDLYGAQGTYNHLAGKEISLCVVKDSMDVFELSPQQVAEEMQNLQAHERELLHKAHQSYAAKYVQVGVFQSGHHFSTDE